jgi:hypothetical protein
MPISRNVLFLIVGALEVAIVALSIKVYDDHRPWKSAQLGIAPPGVSAGQK